MAVMVQPDSERARQIIQGWLVSHNRSIRSLAKEAGIQPSILSRFLNGETTLEAGSAIKLYDILHQDMDHLNRRTFLKVMGLLPLALAFSRDSPFTIDLQSVDTTSAGPYQIGTRLMVLGDNLVARDSWEEAIPLFREAENVLGVASSQAARAACMTAQMLINLGDYDKAQEEVIRVQHTYESVMDPETELELHRIRGWLDYYQGSFFQSERWLRECLRIAEQSGIERLGESAQHFLGRVYCDWAQTCRQRQEADALLHKAEVQFDKAYQIHLKWGTESQRAFDLLRKAQLLRVQRQWRDAQELRNRARQMFGRSLAVLHIDLEEARLALEDGEIRVPRLEAEEALREWAQIRYAKGMSNALRILGALGCTQGKPEQALELYVAALCVYPFEEHLDNRRLWAEISGIYSEMVYRGDRGAYQRLVRGIQESVESRQGYFSYLNNVSAGRTADVARILNRLNSVRA